VVLDLQVAPESDTSSISNWTVKLGPGTASWSQRDTIDRAAKTIRFERLAGDIDVFSGRWAVRDIAGGCSVTFSVEFDTGLFLLAGVVEPMIANLLRENIAAIISGLFGTAASVHAQSS
jgi:ribosome-associated toxin RatA of RatAB toxin-antitoxin module